MIRLVAFRYAWNGVIFFITRERHAPIHLIVGGISIVLGLILNVSMGEWVALLLCTGMVISMEILNSSIERLTDIVSPQRNESARVVKDMGAAAVLISSFFAAMVGLIIFAPKLYDLLIV